MPSVVRSRSPILKPRAKQIGPLSISIVFITVRAEPHLDWLVEGLRDQAMDGDSIEIIVVDGFADDSADRRRKLFSDAGVAHHPATDRARAMVPTHAPDRVFYMRYSRVKPNIWQGPHRSTRQDWWAIATARNTGIVLASHDYVAFCDDRARIGAHWLSACRRGNSERVAVLAGTYDKRQMGPAGPELSVDNRIREKPAGMVNCGGGWLYGCTSAMPLEWLLEVNGFEEGCDGMGGEDYTLGLMLTNRGRRIDFTPTLVTHQDRMPGTEHGMKRTDKGVSPNDKSHAALARFGKRVRTEFTPDLRVLRAASARGEAWPLPTPAGEARDWYDGQLLSEM